MKRERVIQALKTAGVENDWQSWTRLYVENRVSLAVAQQQWRDGQRWAEFVKYRNERVDALLGENVVISPQDINYARDRLNGAQGD